MANTRLDVWRLTNIIEKDGVKIASDIIEKACELAVKDAEQRYKNSYYDGDKTGITVKCSKSKAGNFTITAKTPDKTIQYIEYGTGALESPGWTSVTTGEPYWFFKVDGNTSLDGCGEMAYKRPSYEMEEVDVWLDENDKPTRYTDDELSWEPDSDDPFVLTKNGRKYLHSDPNITKRQYVLDKKGNKKLKENQSEFRDDLAITQGNYGNHVMGHVRRHFGDYLQKVMK